MRNELKTEATVRYLAEAVLAGRKVCLASATRKDANRIIALVRARLGSTQGITVHVPGEETLGA